MPRFLIPILLFATLFLSGCQIPMQGVVVGDIYHAPQKAYAIPLDLHTFRGHVTIEERCNQTGGSAHIWDDVGRHFVIDHLVIDENDLAQTPMFASEQTIMNLVMNNYIRQVMKNSVKITSTDTVKRDYLRMDNFNALFSLASIDVKDKEIRGTFYYGFLLFKRREIVYVIQHRMPAMTPEKMKNVLLEVANAMIIPATETRVETESEKFMRDLENFFARLRIPGATYRESAAASICNAL